MADVPESSRELLALSEARLRRAQVVARLGSWEIDLATRRMWGSDEAFRIYGLETPPDRQLPLALVQTIPLPEHRAQLDRALADLLAGARPYEEQFWIRRHDDGALREIHSYAEVIARDEAGRPLRVTGTLQDVTEREQRARSLLEALRTSEERARIVFDQAADAILIGTATGDLLRANEEAVRLTGYPREELTRLNVRTLFAREVLAARPFRFDRVLAGETVVSERDLTRKDGSAVPIEMRAVRLSDGTLQAIIRDVSERRRLEDQLQLRQRMDSIGTLASGIAHDFNNVLAGIMGYADLLRMDSGGFSPFQLEALEAILLSCRRAAALVNGLQTLARPASASVASYDVGAVASEVFGVLQETTDRLVEKVQRIPPGRHFARGSASGLYHALMNVGVNAVQAIEEKGAAPGDRVVAEAEEWVAPEGNRLGLASGPYVHVAVRDSGVGMAPAVRERAFDPLFTTKEKGERKGQGLGLAMVYNVVVRQHRGAIDVETGEGRGSTFHLYLPRGDPSEARVHEPEAGALPGGSETILVVEDERIIASLARRILGQRGYTVLVANDGEEGVELFSRRAAEIGLVLLDRTLPKLPGEEVLARIRAQRPDVRVIVSSGDVSLSPEMFGAAAAVLRKPYTAAEMCGLVREVLDRPSGQ